MPEFRETTMMVLAIAVATLLAIPLLSNLSASVDVRTRNVGINDTTSLVDIINGTARNLLTEPIGSIVVTNASHAGPANISALLETTSYTVSGAVFTLTNRSWNNSDLRAVYTRDPEGSINGTSRGITNVVPIIFAVLIMAGIAFAVFA